MSGAVLRKDMAEMCIDVSYELVSYELVSYELVSYELVSCELMSRGL
jgi:hypothetical protein